MGGCLPLHPTLSFPTSKVHTKDAIKNIFSIGTVCFCLMFVWSSLYVSPFTQHHHLSCSLHPEEPANQSQSSPLTATIIQSVAEGKEQGGRGIGKILEKGAGGMVW